MRGEKALVLPRRRADVEVGPEIVRPLQTDSLRKHATEPVPQARNTRSVGGDGRPRQSPFVDDEIGEQYAHTTNLVADPIHSQR
jgi:hypothetical protein